MCVTTGKSWVKDERVWPLFVLWIVVRSSKVRITDLEQAQMPINDLNKDNIDKRRWELNPLIILPFVWVVCSSSFLPFVQNRGLMWWVNMVQLYNQEEIEPSQSPWQENIKRDFHFTRPNALSPFIDLLERPQQAQPALDRLIMGDLYPSLFYTQHSRPISPDHMRLSLGEEEKRFFIPHR